MKISIIVPAFNEEKFIAGTIGVIQGAARSFHERGWETEIIICDNNSKDATPQLARAAGARVVFEPVNQIARARNAGAAAATGDWFVFVDADSRPTPELFAEVAREISSGTCLAGGCTVLMDEKHLIASSATALWNTISRLARWAAGSFIFCEAAAFRQLDGFSLELFASEEIDLSKRLKKLARASGKRIVILHRHPLLTSARKMHLYSRAELLRFMASAVFRPRATITSRQACSPWYDGRR
jgi:glycosyltransferase involved in cell wall biosynthesis